MIKQAITLLTVISILTANTGWAAPNRLKDSKSPYVRLHKDNPIDWYEWGDEAFAKARETGKPLLISIGYFSCHWCHVMNEETFSNAEVGKLLNELFVCIKVDRQEHPDIDNLYMSFLKMSTGSGGWPQTIFADSDGTPFFGGTFFPPHDDYGLPGLLKLAPKIADIYKKNRGEVTERSAKVLRALKNINTFKPQGGLSIKPADDALDEMGGFYDWENGGFGHKPKFPHESSLSFILEYQNSTPADFKMVRHALDKMADGGIYDHIGGGFHRYAVDEKWTVPHFEKMLYTNAVLLKLYVRMYRLTRDTKYLNVAKDVAGFVLRDMYRPGGGFWPAIDADSPGGEGSFYVWSRDELLTLLGNEDGAIVADYYGITEPGNFSSLKSVPRISISAEDLSKKHKVTIEKLKKLLSYAKQKMYAARTKRPAPATEKSVIASWSAMMTSGLIELYSVTGTPIYKVVTEKTLKFLERSMTVDGVLRHTFMDKKAGEDSYIEDYAHTITAWLDLFETTQDIKYLQKAQNMAKEAIRLFGDKKRGGFFLSANENPFMGVRQKVYSDSVIPSGAALMATNLLKLYALTGNKQYRITAIDTLKNAHSAGGMSALMTGSYLSALSAGVGGLQEFALVGSAKNQAVMRALAKIQMAPYFNRVIILLDPANRSIIPDQHKDKLGPQNGPILYICNNFTCDKPLDGLSAISEVIESRYKENYDSK